MSLTINRADRDALYEALVTDLSAIGDISIDLHNEEPAKARRLWRRFEVEMRLLDDLGWERQPERERFELRMPAVQLRPIIERVYWAAVQTLAEDPEELDEEVVQQLRHATSACPEILGRLADEELPEPEHRGGCEAAA